MNNLTFKELRKYISKINRISICKKEDLSYDNYRFMKDVPVSYDDYYVYGIGMIESEFPSAWIYNPGEFRNKEPGKETVMASCLEIMVSETPKE